MSTNSRRRKEAREATANHGPVQKPNLGANRAQRRTSMVARVRNLRPLTDRERQYIRAAGRKQRAAA